MIFHSISNIVRGDPPVRRKGNHVVLDYSVLISQGCSGGTEKYIVRGTHGCRWTRRTRCIDLFAPVRFLPVIWHFIIPDGMHRRVFQSRRALAQQGSHGDLHTCFVIETVPRSFRIDKARNVWSGLITQRGTLSLATGEKRKKKLSSRGIVVPFSLHEVRMLVVDEWRWKSRCWNGEIKS